MLLTLWVDISQLGVSVAALIVLLVYTYYTRRIAEQSVRQIESMAQPALVAELDEHDQNAISFRNIGTGAAISITWRLYDIEGKIQHVEAGASIPVKFIDENNALSRLQRQFIGNDHPPIILTYDGMSGAGYESRSTLNDMRDQFSTVFIRRNEQRAASKGQIHNGN